MKQTNNNLFRLHESLQFTGGSFRRGVSYKRFSPIMRRAYFIRILTRA